MSLGQRTLWVLAIGVSHYAEPRLRLRFAATDARAIAEAFERQRGGPLYRDVKTEVLLDDAVTRGSVLRALDEFLGKASPIDVGVIYLAGHGVRDETLDTYYFLPANAAADKPQIDGLDMDDFNRELRQLHRSVLQLVVVIDTCHAGGAVQPAGRWRLGEDLAARLPPAEGLYVLAAAKSGEQSRELAALGHGAFTKALLDGLDGQAPEASGLITVLGLATYVSHRVPQLTERGQTPYLSIIGEDLPLIADPHKLAQVTPPPLPSPAQIVAPARQRERLAVMHFDNLRPDPQHDWMQQALGEQFATALHRASRFDIYDERMVRFLARGEADPIEASRRADMGKMVSGAYWVSNDRISITAHVRDTQPLRSIAAAEIEGPIEQFSQLTSRVVVDLLSQLHLDLSPAETDRLLAGPSTDLEARKLLYDAERPGREATAPRAKDATAEPHAGAERWGFTLPGMASTAYAADLIDPESELRATLEGYRRAFLTKDVESLVRYYSALTDEQKGAFRRYFDNADDLQVEFSEVQVAIIGDEAAVSFMRADTFVDHESGRRHEVVVRVTKLFARGAQGWQIVPER